MPIPIYKYSKNSELIMKLNDVIQEMYPQKSDFDFIFLYNGERLVFNSKPINIKNGDCIVAAEIENDNNIKINDNEFKNIEINQKNYFYNKNSEKIINIKLISTDQKIHFFFKVKTSITCTGLIKMLFETIWKEYPEYKENELYFLWNGCKLHFSLKTLESLGLTDNSTIIAYIIDPLLEENIEIQTSVIIYNDHDTIIDFDFYGLIRLCFIKEIALIIANESEYYEDKITDKIKYILEIIAGGNIDLNETKNSIMSMLKKCDGINMIYFSKFLDENLTKNEILELFNLLQNKGKDNIEELKNCLASYTEYMKLFEEEFERAKKESIFEYSLTSLTIVDRKDIKEFKEIKKICPNRKERLLFHGTGIEPTALILTGKFKKSEKSGYQHGKGVYFTDSLDYAWYYGGNDNRANLNIIPKVEEAFRFVGSFVYYNENGYKRVYNYKYTPKKNEINFAYVDSFTHTILNKEPDKTRFYGTEYVIEDLDQICTFIGCTLKREEFCVIWRDTNFSENPVYNNEFDEIFKKFLKNRMDYIKKEIKFNVYPCETSEEALKLIKRKKYNKIILISNVGNDLKEKEFISEARKIIGSDIIALFLCYNIQHLKWIKNYKNALFSNDPLFYEQYLQCFSEVENDLNKKDIKIKENLIELKQNIEKKYKVQFNFSNDFFTYKNFKNEGKFSDLTF